MSEKDKKRIRIVDWYRYTTNGRKRHQRWNALSHMIWVQNDHTSHTGMSTTCIVGRCHKSCPLIISNTETINLTFTKTSYKAMVKTVTKDASLKLILIILRNYRRQSDVPFLPWRMKIDKCRKVVCNLYGKKNYAIHIRAMKHALYHRLILGKVHRVIEINQEACLKPCIDLNTELRTKAKNDSEK